MTKEDMINILNQHGLDVLYDVISDELQTETDNAFSIGYAEGYHDGCDWDDCY